VWIWSEAATVQVYIFARDEVSKSQMLAKSARCVFSSQANRSAAVPRLIVLNASSGAKSGVPSLSRVVGETGTGVLTFPAIHFKDSVLPKFRSTVNEPKIVACSQNEEQQAPGLLLYSLR
jgi:hypothetical protein